MIRLRLAPATLALLIALTATLTTAAATRAAAAKGYANLLGLESQYMCLSCHEPLELVSSPQAQSEKATLKQLVAQGYTQSQIRAAMVAQYGTQVLARPPASGFNLTIYVLPPAVLVIGAAALLFTLPKWRARSRRLAGPAAAPPLRADDARRLDDELARFL